HAVGLAGLAGAIGTAAKNAEAIAPAEPSAAEVEVDIESEVVDVEAVETEAASGPAVAPLLDEEEDRDIQEMILSRAEELDEAGEAGEGIEDSDEIEIEAAGEAGDESGSESQPEAGNAAALAGDRAGQADSGT